MGGSNHELQEMIDGLVDRAGAYGMEVSTGKSKVLVNSARDISAAILMNGGKLEEVEAFI